MAPAPPDLQTLMAEAVRHHQAGRLNDAERLYRQILQIDPRNAFALHLFGILAHQAGRSDIAADLIGQAIAQNGAVATFHNSLGNALMAQQRFEEAAAAYGRALTLEPNLAEAHCNLGAALAQQGKLEEAAASYRAALHHRPDYVRALVSLGDALAALGKLDEAVASYRQALTFAPGDAGAHNNLGNALKAQGRLDDAAACYRQALALQPQLAAAHNNLGGVLAERGRTEEAIAAYREALVCQPGFAEAHRNLGNVLMAQGRPAEAEAAYAAALAARPDDAEAHNNLGTALAAQGWLEAAAESWRRALALKPDFDLAGRNLALLLSDMGRHRAAIEVIQQSLGHNETPEAKRSFVACARHADGMEDDGQFRALMIRALGEAWGRPNDLANSAVALVMRDDAIAGCVNRAMTAWPARPSAGDLLKAPGFSRLAADPLLLTLLASVPVCDARLERYLTMVRHALLETVEVKGDQAMESEFFSALAQQCFLNDYVFALDEDELGGARALAQLLAAALAEGARVPELWIVTVAAYLPLASIPGTAQLLTMQWPAPVQALLAQQVAEPAQEAVERSNIPRLTGIDDRTSVAVRAQYEESPFPRWTKIPLTGNPKTLARYLSDKFSLSAFRRPAARDIGILIAGCGTGQHAIETALQFQHAHVTAIDLSLASLGYARRKTHELGIASITYAQADLLALDWSGLPFDVIEAVGVLHHLADPWAGWRKLLTLLRPGGFMHVALYSELGRRQVVEIRNLIAAGGYGPTPADIRRFRQDLMDRDTDYRKTTESVDFNNLSMCRDLLFHVQEQRLSLSAIAEFLRDNGLLFLGFELDMGTLSFYQRRFPGDPACIDLSQWQIFENENPDTFSGMYNFWIQTPGPA